MKSTKLGAELLSFKVNGEEKIHQGPEVLDENNKVYWKRHFPILFPIVGKLKDNKTEILGKTYEMTQHGFARDLEFEELVKEENLHSYILKSNKITKEKYPFDFELKVSYKKEDNKLSTEYLVKNTGNQTMEFGIGGHPAFRIDKKDLKNGEYYLEFQENEENAKFYHLIGGLLDETPIESKIENSKEISINEHSFDDDAIIIKNLKSHTIYLKKKSNNKVILKMNFEGFPFLGIWAKPGAPFVCIEPWYSTTDKLSSNGKFNEKDLIKIEPQKEFKCEYNVQFY